MSGLPEPPESEAAIKATSDEVTGYAGLATRVISFTADAAVISVVAIAVGTGAVLIQGVLHLPHTAQTVLKAIGAAAYVLGTIGYFVAFWSTTGQTPGARVMQIRVVTAKGDRLKPRRALIRCGGVVLAALPLFAGFVPILFDSKRRGFQDYLAHTVVVEAPQLSLAGSSKLRRKAAYEAVRPRPDQRSPSPWSGSGDAEGTDLADRPLDTRAIAVTTAHAEETTSE